MYIQKHRITVLWLTAGPFHHLAERPALSATCARSERCWRRRSAVGTTRAGVHRALPGCRLINGYGPTEATTFSACALLDDPEALQPSVPIGRAISNARRYVLDQQLNPVPVGTVGELYIGGAGLARGYLGRPGSSAHASIANPFGSGDRLYLTGDLVRIALTAAWSSSAAATGRSSCADTGSNWAKSNRCCRRREVAQAAVALRGHTTSDKRLVAYVVCRESGAAGPEGLVANCGPLSGSTCRSTWCQRQKCRWKVCR